MLFGVSLQEGTPLKVSLWYILASRGCKRDVSQRHISASAELSKTWSNLDNEFPHPFPLPSPPTPSRVDSEGGKSFPSHINPKCFPEEWIRIDTAKVFQVREVSVTNSAISRFSQLSLNRKWAREGCKPCFHRLNRLASFPQRQIIAIESFRSMFFTESVRVTYRKPLGVTWPNSSGFETSKL